MAARRMHNTYPQGRRLILCLACLCVLFSGSLRARAADVLVVHSYHAGYDWVDGVNGPIEKAFRQAGISYRIAYMDTKRHPDEAWKKASGERAKALVETEQPVVVIAVDDNAQTYFAKAYAGRSAPQFIFCGVNAAPERYGYPAANVTGILERSYVGQSLRLLHMINPYWDAIAWISDDSPTAHGVLARVQAYHEGGKLPLPLIAISQPADYDAWKRTILAYQQDARVKALLIPLYHTVKDGGSGRSVRPAEVMRWTTAHTSKPIVGLWPFSTTDGALCAVVVDPQEHGRVAALMAQQLLAGKTAAEVPVVTNQSGYVVVNLQRAAALKVEIPFEILQTADKLIE